MKVLLLVSAAALLAWLSLAAPLHRDTQLNLEKIYQLAANRSRPEGLLKFMVEDVENLTQPCEQEFFCKVQHILEKHHKLASREQELIHTLRQYNRGHYNTSCEARSPKAASGGSSDLVEVRSLLDLLILCVQQVNLLSSTAKS